MCYAFEMLAGDPLTAVRIKEVFDHVERVAPDGWACWAFSNHDVQRHVSRWNLSDAAARMFPILMMCLRGSACIYQGEELGLPEAEVPFEALQDPYGIEFWPEFKGRDGCRTPMVWDKQAENSGFGKGATWLPVGQQHTQMAVGSQINDPASMLNHYRAVIAFRHANSTLASGTLEDMATNGDLLTFKRIANGETIFCAFNIGETPSTTTLPNGTWESIGTTLGGAEPSNKKIELAGWQACIARKLED